MIFFINCKSDVRKVFLLEPEPHTENEKYCFLPLPCAGLDSHDRFLSGIPFSLIFLYIAHELNVTL